jgi:hypothetical protein
MNDQKWMRYKQNNHFFRNHISSLSSVKKKFRKIEKIASRSTPSDMLVVYPRENSVRILLNDFSRQTFVAYPCQRRDVCPCYSTYGSSISFLDRRSIQDRR